MKRLNRAGKGFSLVELMLVMAVMAMIATLAIGAVAQASKASREKRIEAVRFTLYTALINYKAQVGTWPVGLQPKRKEDTTVSFSNEENWQVFDPLIPRKGTKKGSYFDASAVLTKINGKVMTVQEAIEQGKTPIPLGYADPKDQSKFCYFDVSFNLIADTVSVNR